MGRQGTKDYFVYRIPTIVLVDKEKKIRGKYSNFEAVQKRKKRY